MTDELSLIFDMENESCCVQVRVQTVARKSRLASPVQPLYFEGAKVPKNGDAIGFFTDGI